MQKQNHYNFDLDHPIAEEMESKLAKMLEDEYGFELVSICHTNEYDLLMKTPSGKNVTIEIKQDFTCFRTGNVGVEFKCRGKPSGISVSKADYYLFVVHIRGQIRYFVMTSKKLRNIIQEKRYFRVVDGGDKGSHSMNYLFKFNVIRAHAKELFRQLDKKQ